MTAINEPVLGRRLPRLDALAKVTGKTVYAMDFSLPGMLYGKLLRSPHPHARILGIDAGAATRRRGVRVVLTAADIPIVRSGGIVRDETVLAVERVRYVGEPVAMVAADTLDLAEEALRDIRVEYEPLPAVLDVEQALQPDALLVHPDWTSYVTTNPNVSRGGNIASRSLIHKGDVDAAFAEADFIFQDRFETRSQHPGYIEPRASVADVDASGHVTVWTNTQLPFAVQTTLAELLNLAPGKLRVIVTAIGGGFGGKLRAGMEPYAVLLAQKTRRPVKVATTVEEELTAAYPRQPAIITLKTGVMRDGTIVAKEGRVVFDTGAFAGAGPIISSVATLTLAGPYKIPNLRLEACAVYTNKAVYGSVRAPGGPQPVFATESQMDIIARKLGMDPLELRLKNIVDEGDLGPTGSVLRGVGLREAIEKAAAAIEWDKPAGADEGKGLACGFWTTTGGSSGVYVKLQTDGTVVLMTGAAEIGTAAVTAGAAQVLADALGVRLEDVEVVLPDTNATPFDFGAQGSRTAFSVGNAGRAAAEDIRRQVFALASAELGVPPEALALGHRTVYVAADPQKCLTLAQCAQISNQRGGGVIAHGTFVAPATEYDKSSVTSHFYPAFHSPSFHAHAAHVSVSRATGEVTVKRYVAAQDVGFAINPTYVEGQIEGGVTQGLGMALYEEIMTQEGRVLNPNLADYKMPTFMDVPRVEPILVEHPSQVGPHGAKGVGEPPVIEVPAAIANAVAAAVGVRITSLPITAEKVLCALHEK